MGPLLNQFVDAGLTAAQMAKAGALAVFFRELVDQTIKQVTGDKPDAAVSKSAPDTADKA